MSRFIIVSNRLPFTVRRQGQRTHLSRSPGGLVAGLGPVHDAQDSLWIGNIGGDLDPGLLAELAKHRLVPVSLPREKARRHYEGFSNGVLWPLFHYFLESMRFDPIDFEAYRSINERFAEAVADHAGPGDRIWIHDYHLMLLPSMLRQRIPNARIGFFLHIPFPSSEIFRVLPVAEDVLKGLIGADLIGLHTYDYTRHLATAFRRITGYQLEGDVIDWEGGRCTVRVFPLGADMPRFTHLAGTPQVERRLGNWRRRVGGRKVVLGVDRLDYSKGIPLRLEAYRRLLAMEPEWRREALFLQLAVPTRSAIPQYRLLKQQVEQLVGEINGEFGELGRMPIHYMYRSVVPEELVALYRLADVAVVTPLRDGMNIVAKEYIASRTEDNGVLVLSEFAGAASELGEALVVNAWDLDGTVRALDRALRMPPEERHRRMAALRRRVASHDAQSWARTFIETLDSVARVQGRAEGRAESDHWRLDLVAALAEAKRALLLLDYDGTLKGFAADPAAGRPDNDLIELLGQLARLPRVQVVLQSGRDQQTLERWFGQLPIDLVAEHGSFLKVFGQEDWEDLVPGLDRSWFPAVEEAMRSYVARTPGSFIEPKHAGMAWHYHKAEPKLGLRQGRELAHHLTEYFANRPLRVHQSEGLVEVHSQEVGKRWAYKALVLRHGAPDFVLAAGDGGTDEDLFQAIGRSAWCIKIGRGSTVARFRLPSPERLRALLSSVIGSYGQAAKGRTATPVSISTARPRPRAPVDTAR